MKTKELYLNLLWLYLKIQAGIKLIIIQVD